MMKRLAHILLGVGCVIMMSVKSCVSYCGKCIIYIYIYISIYDILWTTPPSHTHTHTHTHTHKNLYIL